MNNLLYIFEEVCELITTKGLDHNERENDEDKFIWSFAKNGSSLHVNTVSQSRYVLYATEKDYNLIHKRAEDKGLGITLKESKKDVIELLVSQYEEVSSKAILFIRNGNKGLLANPDEKKLSHVIYFFTNENLEFILDCLAENELYSEKIRQEKIYAEKLKASEELKALATAQTKLMKSQKYGRSRLSAPASEGSSVKNIKSTAYGVASATIFTKTASAGSNTAASELTDEEIKNVIPEGCLVSHKKYGQGTVKAILEGKIDVLFEDSVEKVFAAQVCINNKLLTVI
jgi:3D (Asp-Asp-Asp) domain-containing protein